MMVAKKRRRSSSEVAADNKLRERYRMLTGKQKIYDKVIPCPDDDGCLNAQHYTLDRSE